MDSNTNAVCDICGLAYKICKTCQWIQSFKPWRTVVDTLDHYRIYLVLSEYTNTHNKEKARHDLEYCDLTELDTFTESTKRTISEILTDDTKDGLEPTDTEPKAKTVRRKSSTKIQYQKQVDVTDTKETIN